MEQAAPRALVADDDLRTVSQLNRVLALLGIDATSHQAIGAIAQAIDEATDDASTTPDVFFIDLRWKTQLESLALFGLPGVKVSGKRSVLGALLALDVIRKQPAFATVPIIICSERVDDESRDADVQRVLEHGQPAAFFDKKRLDVAGGEMDLYRTLQELGVALPPEDYFAEQLRQVTREQVLPVVQRIARTLGLTDDRVQALVYASPKRDKKSLHLSQVERTRLDRLIDLAVGIEALSGKTEPARATKARNFVLDGESIAERLAPGRFEEVDRICTIIEMRLGGPLRWPR